MFPYGKTSVPSPSGLQLLVLQECTLHDLILVDVRTSLLPGEGQPLTFNTGKCMQILGVQNLTLNQYIYREEGIQYLGSTNLKKSRIMQFRATQYSDQLNKFRSA